LILFPAEDEGRCNFYCQTKCNVSVFDITVQVKRSAQSGVFYNNIKIKYRSRFQKDHRLTHRLRRRRFCKKIGTMLLVSFLCNPNHDSLAQLVRATDS
jgi:hypothetical protein